MGRREISRRRRWAWGVVVLFALTAPPFGATAASLGGIVSADLYAWSDAASVPVPTPIAEDDFDCRGFLDGRKDLYGNVWVDHRGRWRCAGGETARATRRVRFGQVTVDVGVSDRLNITTYVSSVSRRRNRSGPGISFLSDGRAHMYVIYERDRGRITLASRDRRGLRSLVTVPISDRDALEMRVELRLPDIAVLVDGAAVINYTLSAAELASFGSNTRFGLEADRDRWSRFDWFRVEALP